MALFSNRRQHAALALHRHARNTNELTGIVLGIAQLSLLENAQEAVKKSVRFTVAALMCEIPRV